MKPQLIALAALALLAAPTVAPAAVFECSSAQTSTREAVTAFTHWVAGAKNKTQRCTAGRDLLPLFDRQVTIAETCEADNHAEVSAVKQNASRIKATYREICGG